MKADTFIQECKSRGISLSISDGSLAYDAPDSAMTDDVLDYLKQHKQEIIDTLTTPVWNGGALDGGACYSCGEHTGAMLTVPYGFVGWCCPDCFDKRAGEPVQRLAA